jgi:hypothetical protein
VIHGQAVPAHTPGVLQVPAVHIIERVLELILTCNDPDRGDRCKSGPEEEHIPDCDLTCEAPYEAALEVFVVTLWSPRTSVAWANERDTVSEENVDI